MLEGHGSKTKFNIEVEALKLFMSCPGSICLEDQNSQYVLGEM